MTTTFFERLAEAEALVAGEPTGEAAAKLVGLLAEPMLAQKIVSRPMTETWLGALRDNGFFANPPMAVSGEKGAVSFPGWVPVFALAATAETMPDIVHSIMQGLPVTNNDWINGHLMDVALKLPPHLAAEWSEREASRILEAEGVHLWLPRSCRKMIEYLVGHGLANSAFELAKAILHLSAVVDTRPSYSLSSDSEHAQRMTTVMKVDEHEYGEIATAVVQKLTPLLGMRTVEHLSSLVEFAVRNDGYEKRPPNDHSYIWRSRIGDRKEVYRKDAHQTLVSPLRDAAVAVAHGEENRSTLMDYLLSREWHVFWRIALYIAANVPAPDSPEVQEVLRDTRWQAHWQELPEYFELLLVVLPTMTEEQRLEHLAWTDGYPDMDGRKQRFAEEYGRQPTEEEQADYEAYRKVRLLWPIRSVLPMKLAEKFQGWHAKRGGKEAEEMERAPKGFQRIDGPKNKDELASMPVEKVFAFVGSGWEPDTSFFSNKRSARALSHELAEDVKARPRDYFRLRQRVIELNDPTWAGAVLHGWREVVWKASDWPSLLEFCRTLVDWGPRKASPRAAEYPHSDFSKSMQWSRMCIIGLLKRGLGVDDETLGIPFELREGVWGLLVELLRDPDPEPGTVSTRDDTPDYDQTAINSVRSEALQCAVWYGVWWVFNTYRNKSERDRRAQVASRMAEIPGLVRVLDQHLDDPKEHPAVWSVYGSSLTWLIWLGRDWVAKSLPKLFPEDDQPPIRRKAVWTTLIRHYRANITANQLLRPVFIKETEKLTGEENERDHVSVESHNRLALHLMIMYWWREVRIDEPPLSTFFAKASDSLRAWAIEYIGNQYADFLRRSEAEEDPTELLRQLWVARNAAAAAKLGLGFEKEMDSFLSFFTAGDSLYGVKKAFGGDEGWVLDRLIESLAWVKNGGGLYDSDLARKFASYAGHALEAKAIRALRLLVEGHLTDFGLSHWLQETDELVKSAANAQDVGTREECYRLINILGSVGITEPYRNFLPADRGGLRAVSLQSDAEPRSSGKEPKSSDKSGKGGSKRSVKRKAQRKAPKIATKSSKKLDGSKSGKKKTNSGRRPSARVRRKRN